MADVEVDLVLAVDAEAHLADDLEDLARRDVARNEILEARISLLEEVPRLAVLHGPHAAAFAAQRFRHQPELVVGRDRGRVDLDELAVAVVDALLVRRGGRGAVADHRLRGFSEDQSRAAGAEIHRVGAERLDVHVLEIHRDVAAADPLVVAHEAEEFPALVLLHEAFALEAPDLLVERVEQLLAGRRARERGAMVQRAAEAAEVDEAFGRAVERNAHAIEQIDDARRRVAHALHERLVGEVVAALHRVLEVDVGVVAFALRVDRAVDAALRAHRMAALHGHEREQIDGNAELADLDGGHQAGKAAADDAHSTRGSHSQRPFRRS